MRWVLKFEDRRIRPWTSYPLFRRNSVRYDPSWPVMPVIRAILRRGGSPPLLTAVELVDSDLGESFWDAIFVSRVLRCLRGRERRCNFGGDVGEV